MLKGHAFNKTKVANWPQCIKACNDATRCQSLNYAIDKGMCELNSRTKEAKPGDFVHDSFQAYMTRPSERGIVKHYVSVCTFNFTADLTRSRGTHAYNYVNLLLILD